MWCCRFPIHIIGIKSLIWLRFGLVPGIVVKAAIVLSIFSFTNCCGYGFMLIFFKLGFYYNDLEQWFPTFLHRVPVKIFKNVRGPATKDS